MAAVAATHRSGYHKDIEGLLQVLSKLEGIDISDFIAAMPNPRQARPMTVLQERIRKAGGGSYSTFCKDMAWEAKYYQAQKYLMKIFGTR